MSFESLALPNFLLRSLEKLGYAEPTPIQAEAIPLILAGKDLRAAAQTGSGKTAAFALPILQGLSAAQEQSRKPRYLVLVPTRELAVQVAEAFERYGEKAPNMARVLAAYGGVGYEAQMKLAYSGVEVVVATPGRLIDLVERRSLELDEVELLTLDEADRLLALGFSEELNQILDMLPPKRQNLLFSATFPQGVVSLADALLKEPARIELESASKPAEKIRQRAIEVSANTRTGLLRHLLEVEGWDLVLVFVSSKRRADNVTAKLVKNGIKAVALHGDMSQDKRARSLQKFKDRKVRILMATDVAARGIDIVGLPCVINYDLPRAPADYVHRVGRTGRAGGDGVAITFVTEETDFQFQQIQKKNGMDPVARERVVGFEPESWNPVNPGKGKAPVKGKRPSKKDKLRRAAAENAESESAADPWKSALRKTRSKS
ncbi:DEAD/DEAH box helicase [Pelagicoccus albus]|uniref:DEAD/DEAH box helicase n=1 Tax=Pelagicoccus albus TaxID=415222 RepID=A0A7X1B7X8_9BACT|nr:DEAD/DEAH box helicase [Pelagicoccus albus]MBC2607328.1 DEAD/DEAH box helicase [Pelagicoccus albus]